MSCPPCDFGMMWSACVALVVHMPGVRMVHVCLSLSSVCFLNFLHAVVDPFAHAFDMWCPLFAGWGYAATAYPWA